MDKPLSNYCGRIEPERTNLHFSLFVKGNFKFVPSALSLFYNFVPTQFESGLFCSGAEKYCL